jgi:hypothetical protein
MKILLPLTFLLLAASSMASADTCGGNGSATFKMRNVTPNNVQFAIYSESGRCSWPAAGEHWNLNDGRMHTFRIACNIGEHVCYGGWYKDQSKYWGVGMNRKYTCSDCCQHCAPNNENLEHSWNLR